MAFGANDDAAASHVEHGVVMRCEREAQLAVKLDVEQREGLDRFERRCDSVVRAHDDANHIVARRRSPHGHLFTRDNARARDLSDAWIRGVLGPWIAGAYPVEVARFEAWTLAHGGVALPLDLIETFDDDLMPGCVVMGVFETLGRLMRAVAKGDDAADAMRDFAFWLHYDGHFELALAALDRCLAIAPDDARARELRDHVRAHLA